MSAEQPERPRRALVFSGGGARGAYEAGVVRYLVEELPVRLGHPIHFDILCGTSVGAIHASYLGATAHQGPNRGVRLVDFWRSMKIDEVLPFSRRDLLNLPRRMFGVRNLADLIRDGQHPERLYGLFDTTHLERMVVRAIPWRNIRRNVAEGRVDAVCLPATEIATGRVKVFVEARELTLPDWTRDPSVVPEVTRLRPTHALASAAIPMLFPVVRVGETYYADGGLRLNTPLSPALRLGADRVLVLSLRPNAARHSENVLEQLRPEDYASPTFVFGKVLNALMLDHLDTDLARMRDMNELIERARKTFGEEFLEKLGELDHASARRFREIDHVVVQPSADLGMLASQVLENLPQFSERSPLFRLAMRNLEPGRRSSEADLLSYLLFDGEFLDPLAELGYADARARENELAAFFTD